MGVGEIPVVLGLRNMSMKMGFVDEMDVDGTFSFFYVGTKRLLTARGG
jgi:hypothetical protein